MSCGRTLGSEEFLLRGLLVVDAIEGEGELFALVLGIRNLHHVHLCAPIFALGVNNYVAFEFVIEERSDSRNHPDRHFAKLQAAEC